MTTLSFLGKMKTIKITTALFSLMLFFSASIHAQLVSLGSPPVGAKQSMQYYRGVAPDGNNIWSVHSIYDTIDDKSYLKILEGEEEHYRTDVWEKE